MSTFLYINGKLTECELVNDPWLGCSGSSFDSFKGRYVINADTINPQPYPKSYHKCLYCGQLNHLEHLHCQYCGGRLV